MQNNDDPPIEKRKYLQIDVMDVSCNQNQNYELQERLQKMD